MISRLAPLLTCACLCLLAGLAFGACLWLIAPAMAHNSLLDYEDDIAGAIESGDKQAEQRARSAYSRVMLEASDEEPDHGCGSHHALSSPPKTTPKDP